MNEECNRSVDVCVVGLGVSSLALLRLLVRSGKTFVVVSERDFGVWSRLAERGDDFDLLSSNAVAAFSWWDFELDFHFFTASDYHQRLEADLCPEIRARTIRARAVRYEELRDGSFDVRLNGDAGTVHCRHLVVTAAQTVDGPGICDTLQETLHLKNKTVVIDGYGDTSNMYMSRLMLGDNKVIFCTEHFQNLDKVFCIDGQSQGWAPLDMFEPYQYLAKYNHERSYRSALCTAVSPYGNTWLSRMFRKQTGLDELMTPDDFYRDDLPPAWKSYLLRTGVNAGFGLPVKYWSVDSFFAHFDDDHRDRMLDHRMLLNDPYFFMKRGDVRVVHPKRVNWVDEHTCEIDGAETHVDRRIKAGIARPAPVQIHSADGSTWSYQYTDCLYGLWNAGRPNVYFLGVERPTTGAFAGTSEIQCEFIHQLIDEPAFHDKFAREFGARFASWKHNYLESGQEYEGLEHSQFTGMTNEELSHAMGKPRRLWPSVMAGEFAAYLTGPGIPARYPELNNANGKYLEFCRLWTNMFAGGLIAKLAWVPLFALNFVVLGLSLGWLPLTVLGVLLAVPLVSKLVNALTYDTLSFGEMTSIFQHLALGTAGCVVLNTVLWATGADSWFVGLPWLVLRSGIPIALLVAAWDIVRAYKGTRLLFNDVRGKEEYEFHYQEYLEAVRSTPWYQSYVATPDGSTERSRS
ncbi:MAG: hypothetical protein KUG77_20945 [Nannocystaceae bacterium]|nr:hypothetical protein [Nannocystaceae bacterium]